MYVCMYRLCDCMFVQVVWCIYRLCVVCTGCLMYVYICLGCVICVQALGLLLIIVYILDKPVVYSYIYIYVVFGKEVVK